MQQIQGCRPHNANHHSMNSLQRSVYHYKFLRYCHTGKKNRTSNALGKKNGNRTNEATDHLHPVTSSFNAIPPAKEATENTGPGIARTMPYPVNRSCFSILLHWVFQPLWGCRPGNVLIEHQWQQYIAAAKYDTAEPVKIFK